MKRLAATTSTSAGALPPRKRVYRQRQQRRSAPRTSLTEVKTFDCMVTVPAAGIPLVAAAAGAEPGAAFVGITELNCIRQGAAFQNRIGAKVVMKSVEFTGELYSPGGATRGPFRLLLVYDRQPNGAFPAITDILYDQPAAAVYYGSGVNMTNKSRFAVLRDLRLTLDPADTQTRLVHTYSKVRLETEYGGDAGTIADIRTGALYLVAFSGALTGADVVSLRNCISRVRFFD